MSLPESLAGPLSRRRFLQLSGAAGAGAFLATSGAAAASRRPAARTTNANPGQEATFATEGGLRMATWIGYIDIGDDGSYPSLDRFTAETGVSIDYQEVVEDNQVFFATDLQGPIEADVPTGWDIVVLTDWMVQRLISLGWLEEIGPSVEGNWPTNLETVYTSRAWDPGNKYAAPYVSGMTGPAFDELVTGPIASLAPLFDDTFAGRITYLLEMNDTVGLAALKDGIALVNHPNFEFPGANISVPGQLGIITAQHGRFRAERSGARFMDMPMVKVPASVVTRNGATRANSNILLPFRRFRFLGLTGSAPGGLGIRIGVHADGQALQHVGSGGVDLHGGVR